MKTENSDFNVFNLNVTITDILLTPFACASLVNEILKGILYQKCQIPYPYSWMKNMVTTKRKNTEIEENKLKNIKAANHFLLVSSIYDKLETAMQDITNEFSQHKSNIKEVLIVLGTTPHTASEVFSIKLVSLVEGHTERNHISQLNKYQQKVLRNIFLSQDWLDKIDASLSCTNIYIYIVKNEDLKKEKTNTTANNSAFVPTMPLTFSKKVKHMKISLISETELNTDCCENLIIFDDTSGGSKLLSKKCDIEETETDITWYKFKDLVKGFKDCFVNKNSVSELW